MTRDSPQLDTCRPSWEKPRPAHVVSEAAPDPWAPGGGGAAGLRGEAPFRTGRGEALTGAPWAGGGARAVLRGMGLGQRRAGSGGGPRSQPQPGTGLPVRWTHRPKPRRASSRGAPAGRRRAPTAWPGRPDASATSPRADVLGEVRPGERTPSRGFQRMKRVRGEAGTSAVADK